MSDFGTGLGWGTERGTAEPKEPVINFASSFFDKTTTNPKKKRKIKTFKDFITESETMTAPHPTRMPKFTQEFKKEFNEFMMDWGYNKDSLHRFSPYWDFAEKYPEYILDEDEKTYLHDKIIVPHANRGTLHKKITERQKFYSIFYGFRDMAKFLFDTYKYKAKDFFDWYENYDMKIFRGIPAQMNFKDEWVPDYTKSPQDLDNGELKPFSLDKDMAMRFTQPGFVSGAWRDIDGRNGWVVEATVKPKNIHLFNNDGSELEVIVKGPLKYDKIWKIRAGKYEK